MGATDAAGARALVALALQAAGQGHTGAALQLLQRARAADPRNPEIPFREGLAQRQLGDEGAALAAFDTALQLAPGHPAILNARGLALKALGRVGDALAAYDQALARAPDFAQALNNRGVLQRQLGRLDDAIASFRCAVQAQPRSAEIHNNLGWTLHQAGRFEQAVASYQAALKLQPRDAQVLSNLGATLHQLARHEDAVTVMQQSLAVDPRSWQTLTNLAVALSALGRDDEALAALARAQALAPGEPDIALHRGNVLLQLDRHDEALAAYEQARAVRGDDAHLLMNIANAWRAAQEHAKAWSWYERAQALAPGDADVRFNHALSLLAGGDFGQGWRAHEARWHARQLHQVEGRFDAPKWLGEEDVAGKTLLLHAEQGLGDTLMMCRYAPLAAARGARVLLRVQKPLVALLREGLRGVDAILGPDDPLPAFDLHCPLMSLPLAFGTTLRDVPAEVPYLHPAPERIARWRDALAPDRPNIGLAWAGNPRFAADRKRSLALAQLLPFLPESARYWCLLKDVPERDQALLQESGRIGRFAQDLFPDTAAQMVSLDLVVTTDTSIAHLAGALGRPTLLLLGSSPDFRWMARRDDSPWYPTLRLLRQARPGDWEPVLARAREVIAQAS